MIHFDQLYKNELRHWLNPATFSKLESVLWSIFNTVFITCNLAHNTVKQTVSHPPQDRQSVTIDCIKTECDLCSLLPGMKLTRVYLLGSAEPSVTRVMTAHLSVMKELLFKIQLLHHHGYRLIVFDMEQPRGCLERERERERERFG